MLDIEQFAEKYRARTWKDECGDLAIFGTMWERQPGPRSCSRMYGHQIYEHSAGRFALMLMFPVEDHEDGGSGKAGKWVRARKKLLDAGFILKQDGDSEGVVLFDPENKAQAKLALKLAGIRRRQLSPERKAALAVQLARAREQRAA